MAKAAAKPEPRKPEVKKPEVKQPAPAPKATPQPVAKPAVPASAQKKICRIISYDKMTPEIKELFEERYPEGYADFVMRYPKPNGESFYAVGLYTPEADYLIKVDVNVDMGIDEDYDSDMSGSDDVEGEESVGDKNSPDVNDLADSLADEVSDPM